MLKRFPGIATKKIDTLIDELEKSKSNELRRFLNALGIPGIGIKLAKEIENALASRPEWVHTLDVPNTFRGRYREDEAHRYAQDATAAVRELVASGRPPAAFICERQAKVSWSARLI